MNKFIFALCAFACCLCFSSESYGGEDLSSQDTYRLLVPDSDSLAVWEMDYQMVAKFFKIYMCPENPDQGWAETNIVSYQKNYDSGSFFHIAWYADGYIVTQINGPKEGYQTVVFGDDIIGVSYPSSRENGVTTTNKYPWGNVTTGLRYQSVEGIDNILQ